MRISVWFCLDTHRVRYQKETYRKYGPTDPEWARTDSQYAHTDAGYARTKSVGVIPLEK